MTRPRLTTRFPTSLLVVLGLVILGISVYWPAATSSALIDDEWGRVAEIAFGGPACPSYDNIFMRPLVGCYIVTLHTLFGNAFWAYHAVSLLWIVLSAVLLYFILNTIIPQHGPVSIASAALFLVYPAVFARLFFERGSYELSLLLFLAAVLCWLSWHRSPNVWRYLLTLSLVLASLLLYEAHIGLIMLTSACFLFVSRRETWFRRLAHTMPLLIAMLWIVGRVLTQLYVDNVHGYVMEDVVISPAEIVRRLYLGLRTVLQWAWTQALAQFVPYQEQPILLLVPLALSIMLTVLLVKLGRRDSAPLALSPRDQRTLALVAAVGMLAVLAGFLPMVTAFGPSLSSVASRINILPSMGAAVAFGAILFVIAGWIGRSPRRTTFTFVILCTPLLIVAAATQHRAQQCAGATWEDQKTMWREITQVAPDVVEGSNIVLLLAQDEHQCIGGAELLGGGPFGLSGALKLVYGREDISGWFGIVDSAARRLVFEPPWWHLIPEENRVVFFYDQKLNKLALLPDGAIPIGTTCNDCLESVPATNTAWRWLID